MAFCILRRSTLLQLETVFSGSQLRCPALHKFSYLLLYQYILVHVVCDHGNIFKFADWMRSLSPFPLQSGSVCEASYAPQLRDLALFVASWLKWNLPRIMASTTFSTQLALFETLKARTGIEVKSGFKVKEVNAESVMPHVLYARWIVCCMTIHLSRSSKVNDSSIASPEQVASTISPLLPHAIEVLQCVISDQQNAACLPMSELADVSAVGGEAVSASSLQCQLCFELGLLLFQQGRFTAACSRLQQVKDLCQSIGADDWYCSVNQSVLDTYLVACLQVTEFPPSALASIGGSQTAKLVTRVEQCRKHYMQVGIMSLGLGGSRYFLLTSV